MIARTISIRAAMAMLLLFTLVVGLVGGAAAEDFTNRVRFAPGTSSASLLGSVVRGNRNVYVLEARGGQFMDVSISSNENNAVFQIEGPNGRQLARAREGDDAVNWSGNLPDSGDYRIIVGGTRGNATYTLRVSIR